MPKSQDANKTSGIGVSIANGTLGYKTVYEHTTSPKTFTPEEQGSNRYALRLYSEIITRLYHLLIVDGSSLTADPMFT